MFLISQKKLSEEKAVRFYLLGIKKPRVLWLTSENVDSIINFGNTPSACAKPILNKNQNKKVISGTLHCRITYVTANQNTNTQHNILPVKV